MSSSTTAGCPASWVDNVPASWIDDVLASGVGDVRVSWVDSNIPASWVNDLLASNPNRLFTKVSSAPLPLPRPLPLPLPRPLPLPLPASRLPAPRVPLTLPDLPALEVDVTSPLILPSTLILASTPSKLTGVLPTPALFSLPSVSTPPTSVASKSSATDSCRLFDSDAAATAIGS